MALQATCKHKHSCNTEQTNGQEMALKATCRQTQALCHLCQDRTNMGHRWSYYLKTTCRVQTHTLSTQNKHGSQMVLKTFRVQRHSVNTEQTWVTHSLNTEQTWVTDGLKNMQSSETLCQHITNMGHRWS